MRIQVPGVILNDYIEAKIRALCKLAIYELIILNIKIDKITPTHKSMSISIEWLKEKVYMYGWVDRLYRKDIKKFLDDEGLSNELAISISKKTGLKCTREYLSSVTTHITENIVHRGKSYFYYIDDVYSGKKPSKEVLDELTNKLKMMISAIKSKYKTWEKVNENIDLDSIRYD